MTHEQKIGYMKIAANLCSFGFDRRQMDLLVSLYDEVQRLGGDMTLRDTARIEDDVKRRADIISRTALLDTVSEQV